MRSAIKRFGKFELIAFIIGFALMAYELAASRILAPAIGSSTYIWTSVIGVIIAALSLGYAAGGIIADKRARQTDIAWLLLLSGLGVVLTLFIAPTALEAVTATKFDARLQGLLSSLALFMPTSFLLGAISPYLVKLRITDLARSGRSAAGLSAFNAVGGITGTFAVGFVFFGYIGTRETLVFIAALLLVSSWIISPLYRWNRRAAATFIIAIVALPLLNPPAGVVADIDTPSSRYLVYDHGYRALVMGPEGTQSGVYLDKPTELIFEYAKHMAGLVALAPEKKSILMLGGGAFTIPAHLADKYPGTHIDVVEIDPQLQDIAKEYFGYRDRSNVTIIDADARTFLIQNTKRYDIVLTDVYQNLSIPFALTTTEYADLLKNSLTDDGLVIANIVGADNPGCSDLLRGLHASHRSAFSQSKLYTMGDTALNRRQNLILVYSNAPQPWLPEERSTSYVIDKAEPFSDNFAPVERLTHTCEANHG